jgi:hypothetical protein
VDLTHSDRTTQTDIHQGNGANCPDDVLKAEQNRQYCLFLTVSFLLAQGREDD